MNAAVLGSTGRQRIHCRSSSSALSYHSGVSSFNKYRIKGACWIALGALQFIVSFVSLMVALPVKKDSCSSDCEVVGT